MMAWRLSILSQPYPVSKAIDICQSMPCRCSPAEHESTFFFVPFWFGQRLCTLTVFVLVLHRPQILDSTFLLWPALLCILLPTHGVICGDVISQHVKALILRNLPCVNGSASAARPYGGQERPALKWTRGSAGTGHFCFQWC